MNGQIWTDKAISTSVDVLNSERLLMCDIDTDVENKQYPLRISMLAHTYIALTKSWIFYFGRIVSEF